MSKITLGSPLSRLRKAGLTPYYINKMKKLGVHTIYDALTYFPFRYNDFRAQDLTQVPDKAKITLKGQVSNHPYTTTYGYRRTILHVRLLTNGYQVRVNFFNQPWLKNKIHFSQIVIVYGRLSVFNNQYQLNAQKLLSGKSAHQMDAVYPSSHRVKQTTIRKTIRFVYEHCHNLIKTYLPSSIMQKYKLEPEPKVIHDLHFPDNMLDERLARRTAKFNDFFLFQMKVQSLREEDKKHQGVQIKYNPTILKKFLDNLPFKLTSAQRRVSGEIIYDLAKPIEMNRLLQGDVGSGKTIVAAIAILATVSSGYQTAIMVPTGVLAKQHAKNLSKTFKGFGINIGLLVSDLKPKDKRELLKHIADGSINLVIGTDALIQEAVKYHHLGLAVIDEQHRFGVDQRQALRMKGHNPNMLAMTATPIPRTLEITAYGDMDVSVIDQLPQGRKPVITKWVHLKQVHQLLSKLKNIMDAGEQIYVVAPLVKQTKHSDQNMLDAETIYYTFQRYFGQNGLLGNYGVGLLHGQMDDEKKDHIMSDFKKKKFNILVATTVIEVGVDVKDASVMMIFNADHFGLSQLHQLRGRVGRGSQQAYCYLIADPKPRSTGVKRMQVMESTTNGFKISKYDLQLRGSGDIFGESQSGIPSFKVGDPIGDRVILECAQQEAFKIVEQNGWQKSPQNLELVHVLRIKEDTKILD